MGYKIYLEIGTNFGNTFNNINCDKMIAVEPKISNMEYGEIKTLRNENYAFYRMTSDDFFNKFNESVDIVFIDGLHEYMQALRDVINSLKIINHGGIVLVHDVDPKDEIEALTDDEFFNGFMKKNPDYTGGWTGDVWKTILHIRSLWDDIHVQTFDIKYGLSVIIKGRFQNRLPYGHATIQSMTFDDFKKKRQEILNIRKYEDIMEDIMHQPILKRFEE